MVSLGRDERRLQVPKAIRDTFRFKQTRAPGTILRLAAVRDALSDLSCRPLQALSWRGCRAVLILSPHYLSSPHSDHRLHVMERWRSRSIKKARDAFRTSLTGNLYLVWTGAYSLVPSIAVGILSDLWIGGVAGLVAGVATEMLAGSAFLAYAIRIRQTDEASRGRIISQASRQVSSQILTTHDSLEYRKMIACHVVHADREIRTIVAAAKSHQVLGDIQHFHLGRCEPADIQCCEVLALNGIATPQAVPQLYFGSHLPFEVPLLFSPALEASQSLEFSVFVDTRDRYERLNAGEVLQITLETLRPASEIVIELVVPRLWGKRPDVDLIDCVAGESLTAIGCVEDFDSDTVKFRWKLEGASPFVPLMRSCRVRLVPQ